MRPEEGETDYGITQTALYIFPSSPLKISPHFSNVSQPPATNLALNAKPEAMSYLAPPEREKHRQGGGLR